MTSRSVVSTVTLFTLAALLCGCAVGPSPDNRPNSAWMPEEAPGATMAACRVAALPAGLVPAAFVPAGQLGSRIPVLSPGDRLRIRLPGDEDRISGNYVVDDNGDLQIAQLGALPAGGLSVQDLTLQLGAALVQAGIVRPIGNPVDVKLLESAGVSVAVAGAVFNPGTTRAGERSAESRAALREANGAGDANSERTVTTALRAAGGVRPDADLARVYLVRGARWTVLDLGEVITGGASPDVTLAAGDRIIVTSSGCFHPELVAPTAVTAPGIRVFMSNLSRPAASNASSAVGRDATSLPYGTRMLQGLVSMNCVGGAVMNAHRKAVLISRNPVNLQSMVVERNIEHLVRNADRDEMDPYLMPGDALACYDSRLMNFQDALGLVSGTVGAATNAALMNSLVR